eukprot:ANDGO_03796.mRNA.1 25S rRNA (cytosine-C(5))-methyltransferase rcm1
MELYYQSAKIVAGLLRNPHRNARSMCYADEIKHKPATLKLVSSILAHLSVLKEVFAAAKSEFSMDVGLQYVLLHELLISKDGLRRRNGQCAAFLKRSQHFKDAFEGVNGPERVEKVSETLQAKQTKSFEQQRWFRVRDLDRVDEIARELSTVDEIFPVGFDDLVPGLLSVPGSFASKLVQHRFLKSGDITLQDKASCLPVVALDPQPGETILDACAAPGNKTTQLASFMKHLGTVVAFDRDPRRAATLKQNVARCRAEMVVQVRQADFLALTADDLASDPVLKNATAALCDPSCSGSGMVQRVGIEKAVGEDANSAKKNMERLQQLADFQYSVVCQAMRFPRMDRVVYSTCSIHRQENEDVVSRVLCDNPEWSLAAALPSWHRRGIEIESLSPEQSKLVARCDPNQDGCHGFFVAKFVRT